MLRHGNAMALFNWEYYLMANDIAKVKDKSMVMHDVDYDKYTRMQWYNIIILT